MPGAKLACKNRMRSHCRLLSDPSRCRVAPPPFLRMASVFEYFVVDSLDSIPPIDLRGLVSKRNFPTSTVILERLHVFTSTGNTTVQPQKCFRAIMEKIYPILDDYLTLRNEIKKNILITKHLIKLRNVYIFINIIIKMMYYFVWGRSCLSNSEPGSFHKFALQIVFEFVICVKCNLYENAFSNTIVDRILSLRNFVTQFDLVSLPYLRCKHNVVIFLILGEES